MRNPPLYRQIADQLTERIRTGVYPLGGVMPTEVELCEEFDASHHTMREALRILTEKGLVVRRAGSGSRVIAVEEPTVFTHSVSNLRQLFRYPEGTVRENLSSGHVTVDAKEAALLLCDPGTPWFKIGSLRRADPRAEPVCWTDFYLLPRYADVVKTRDHLTAPLVEQIDRLYGQKVEQAHVDFMAGRIPAGVAPHLHVEPGAPAMVALRRYADAAGNIFMATISYHPEGRYMASFDFRREVRRR